MVTADGIDRDFQVALPEYTGKADSRPIDIGKVLGFEGNENGGHHGETMPQATYLLERLATLDARTASDR